MNAFNRPSSSHRAANAQRLVRKLGRPGFLFALGLILALGALGGPAAAQVPVAKAPPLVKAAAAPQQTGPAACAGAACVRVSARLASIDSQRGALLNALMTTLLNTNVNITAVEWDAVADADIGLLDLLEALQLNLALATPAEALTTDLTLAQLLTAAADVAQADGDTAAANALDALAVQVGALTGTIQLGDLLVVDFPIGELANVQLDLLDLVTGSVSLFNYENVLTTPNAVTLSGAALGLGSLLNSVALQAQVLEPPIFTCGPEGTTFHSAEIRLKLDVDLVDTTVGLGGLPVGTTANVTVGDVELYVEIARAQGTLQLIDLLAPSITVQAIPGVVDIYLGTIADSLFFNRTHIIDPDTDVTPTTIGSLAVSIPLSGINLNVAVGAKATAEGDHPIADILVFNGPFPETQTVNTSAAFVTDLVSELVGNLELTVSGLGAVPPLILNAILASLDTTVSGILTPVVEDLLTDLADPLLETLGIRVGEADVTVYGLGEPCADLAIVKCDVPDPAAVGRPLIFALCARNLGPQGAPGVVVTDSLPAGVTYVSATPSQGSCAEAAGVVTCSLGSLAAGATATVGVRVTPTMTGTLSNTATITGAVRDDNPANDQSTSTTLVLPASSAESCLEGACVRVSARLASIDSKRGALLNALTSTLLNTSVTITAVEWDAIADADISLLDLLSFLQADLALATPQEVLTANATLAQILSAAADVAQADGDTAAANALNAIVLQIPGLVSTIQLGDLLQIDFPLGELANVNLDLLDLVTGTISLFNYENVATTPNPITLSGAALGLGSLLNSVAIQAQVLEPPIYICDQENADFHSAEVRLKLDVDLVDVTVALGGLPVGVTADLTVGDLDLYVEVARTQGTIQTIDLITPAITVQATPGVVDVYLGTIADSLFWNRTHIIVPGTDVTSTTVGSVTVTTTLPPLTVTGSVLARAVAEGDAPSPTNLIFNGPFPETQTIDTGVTFLSNLLADLSSDLTISVSGLGILGPVLEAAVAAAVDLVIDGILSPRISSLLTDLVDPLLETLGIRLGESDITVYGITRECADLALSKCDIPDPALLGGELTYVLTAANLGTAIAPNVRVTDTLPAGVIYVSATPSQGSCSQAAGTVTCNFGSLPVNGVAFAFVVVRPTSVGLLCNNATIGSDGRYDPNPGDNDPTACTEVFGGHVSGTVWQDTDGDGVRDSNTNALVATTVSGADGSYGFADLPAGSYRVDVVNASVPPGLSVAPGTTDPSAIFVISPTTPSAVVDFGYLGSNPATAAVEGIVWHDPDADGLRDAGETGIGGVTLNLLADLDGNGVFTDVAATTTSAADGTYHFTGVAPGTYRVDVTDTGGALTGYSLTSGPQSNPDPSPPFALRAGDGLSGVDFGYDRNDLRSITDRVWQDADGDGLLDPGEPGMPGVSFNLLDSLGRVVATTTSAADGTVTFTGVPDGNYTLQVTDVDGVLVDQTGTTPQSVAGSHPVTVAGADVTGEHFGYRRPGSIAGTVFEDADGDGVRDPGEVALAGVTVALWADADANGIFDNTLDTFLGSLPSDGSGDYVFAGLGAGTYFASVDNSQAALSGYSPTTTDQELGPNAPGTQREVILTSGVNGVSSAADVDFGYLKAALADVSGHVFDDRDRDGTDDGAADPPIGGVTVVLVNPNGDIVATTVTDANGLYTFPDVPPGAYVVRVTDDGGVLQGYVTTTGGDERPVVVGPTDITDADFGYVRDPLTASLGGLVWHDGDHDGIHDGAEGGIPGVQLELVDPGPNGVPGGGDDLVLATTSTDNDGRYSFPGLGAGSYFINVVDATVPPGLSLTSGPQSGPDPSTLRTLSPGLEVDNVGFGYAATVGSALGDLVWYDADADGVQDPGEPGIPGVAVTVNGPSGIFTVSTDEYGSWYVGGLLPGSYSVSVNTATLPPGYNVTPTNGATSRTINLLVNRDALYGDFGFNAPPALTGTVNGSAWVDEDGDGLQDPGEPPLPFVTVDLVSPGTDNTFGTTDDYVLATGITDANGDYSFVGVPPGDYRVHVTDHDGVTDGLNQSAGSNPTGTLVVTGGGTVTADFPFQPAPGSVGDLVWRDLNGDGDFDPGEPGVEGVTLDLWLDVDGDGVIDPGLDNLLRNTTSDENGRYDFYGLPPGDYIVAVTDADNVLAGFTLPAPVQAVSITPAIPVVDTIDFGAVATNPQTISGLTFRDNDANGLYNPMVDNLVPGITLRLYRDLNGDGILDPADPLIGRTVSDGFGAYDFPGLPNGNYLIVSDATGSVVDGYFQTTQTTTRAVQPVQVNGAPVTEQNFGFAAAPGAAPANPVQLTSFTARRVGLAVVLAWTTESEIKHAGFRLWREAAPGSLSLVGPPLIPARGSELGGAAYRYTDYAAPRAALRYWLEDVSTTGKLTRHGPLLVPQSRGRPIELPGPRTPGVTSTGPEVVQ